MKILVVLVRILLGLVFTTGGLNVFLHFLPTPPIPGPAGVFTGVLISSHYVYLIGGTQLVAGALLLADQFVPFALALLAPMLANIWAYHLTLEHSGAQMALVVTVLWAFLTWKFWPAFAPLLVRKGVQS